jgi:hypothetical protein
MPGPGSIAQVIAHVRLPSSFSGSDEFKRIMLEVTDLAFLRPDSSSPASPVKGGLSKMFVTLLLLAFPFTGSEAKFAWSKKKGKVGGDNVSEHTLSSGDAEKPQASSSKRKRL